MEAILEFLVNNYLWFLIISLILIFGLIGYIVDSHEKKAPKLRFQNDDDINMNINNEVDENESLKEMIEKNDTETETSVINEVIEEDPVAEAITTNIEELEPQNELPKE